MKNGWRQKILTITIPSYNVEDYLENCLDSFIDENVMEDIEVLIVNDGSLDATAEIAARYEQQYPQTFRLITKENGGHGSTINTGVSEAAGIYFKVVDGDDWVDTKSFVRLVEYLKSTPADIVASNYTWIDHTTKQPTQRQEYPYQNIEYGRIYPFAEIVGKAFIDMHAMTIKTELIRMANAPIDEHTFYVDMEFVAFPIPYVETVCFIEDAVYQYRLGLPNQSMSIQKMQKNMQNHMRVLMRLNRYYHQVKSGLAREKGTYINTVVASMLTSQIKIYVSFPLGSGMRREIMKLEAYFYRHNREAFELVKNPAVLLMRKTRYLAFPLVVALFKGRRNSF